MNVKRVIMYVAVAAMAMVIGKKVSPTNETASDVLLMNVEALANEEHIIPAECYGVGNLCCPNTHEKVKYVLKPYTLE